MTNLCNFIKISSLYRCSKCGFTVGVNVKKPPKRLCDIISNETLAISKAVDYSWLMCKYRSKPINTVNGATAGCGCQSTTVEVYNCNYFNETVLKQAADRCLDKIKSIHNSYTGRTCRNCQMYKHDDKLRILHFTFRENWQDLARRSEFALSQNGMQSHSIELVRPSAAEIENAIQHYRPSVAINHGFNVRYSEFIKIARRHENIKFIVIDHSNQNHTLTWPSYFTDEKVVLNATNELNNLWYASPDSFCPWNNLGYNKFFHWPNPVYINKDWEQVPIHRTPSIAIAGRTDWMKAFPVQVAACAIVQKKRELKVFFVFRDSEDRQRGLREHARACRLEFDLHPWGDTDSWERFLANDIDLVCQSTFSDSFNYISIDAASLGKPFIGSHAILHTPKEWLVTNPNDTFEVAEKIEFILDNYSTESLKARRIAEDVAQRNNKMYATKMKEIQAYS